MNTKTQLLKKLIKEEVKRQITEDLAKVKRGAIDRLSGFFRVSPSSLNKFKFDGTDDIKQLTNALNSTSDEGTKLYYDMSIKLAKQEHDIK